ncbi:hypothetical protein F5050DRAFT_1567300, partial [Lentinula boryana]
INGEPARALIDTGSLGDIILSKLADQLNVQKSVLATPLLLQLAIQGSQSKINYETHVKLEYQQISEN